MDLNHKQIGAAIRKRRKAAKMTQGALATLAGIPDRHTVCKYEKGARVPSLDQLARIADELGCSVSTLLKQAGG